MTIPTAKPVSRTDASAGHTYAIPVVRELPRPAAGLIDDRNW
jgi:hypothetical protein